MRRRLSGTLASTRRALTLGGVVATALVVGGCGTSGQDAGPKLKTPHRAASSRHIRAAVAESSRRTRLASKRPEPTALSVQSCLQRAGLDNVTETSPGRWQGTAGDHPSNVELASVFVLGPYSSAAAVRQALRTTSSAETGAAGGVYLLLGSISGHLGSHISAAASCLHALSRSIHRPHKSKHYTF